MIFTCLLVVGLGPLGMGLDRASARALADLFSLGGGLRGFDSGLKMYQEREQYRSLGTELNDIFAASSS